MDDDDDDDDKSALLEGQEDREINGTKTGRVLRERKVRSHAKHARSALREREQGRQAGRQAGIVFFIFSSSSSFPLVVVPCQRNNSIFYSFASIIVRSRSEREKAEFGVGRKKR